MSWSNKDGGSVGLLGGRRTFGPLFLMGATCFSVIFFWATCVRFDGDIRKSAAFLLERKWEGLREIHPSWEEIYQAATTLVLPYMAVELLFMRLLPGARFEGPVAPSGHVPIYKANGVPAYVCTMLLYAILSLAGIYVPGTLYARYGGVLAFMNTFSLLFCVFLYIKGRLFPSGKDVLVTGNVVKDYFTGVELYPRILGWDVKVFSNCRFGMMLWPVAVLDYVFAQHALYGRVYNSLLISAALQLIYVSKFFYWETGYFRSMDIMHDRAGYYLCWGCFTFVPSFYTLHAFYMVNHPYDHPLPVAIGIFVCGVLAIFINYDCDRQRQEFRAKDGKLNIWGKPAQFITAQYKTEKGETKTSVLLLSGWWGISRHFHYVPEVAAAFCWGGAAGGFVNTIPHFYWLFLSILLLDRAFRDDARCREKYTKDWEKYCARVPYKIVPFIL